MEESTIYKRVSVRRFTDEPVTDEEIRELLRAAMNAPSAHNRQPWRFLVIRDKEEGKIISENINTASFAKYAPCNILVLGQLYEAKGIAFIEDCSAAVENLLLRAVEIGLGACWVGIVHMPDRVDWVQKHFGIAYPYFPFAFVSVGHPGREYTAKDTFDESKIFWDKFDAKDMIEA